MSLNPFESLISEFGQSLGLPELSLDEESRCHLVVDEELLVSFEFQTEEGRLLLSSPIGDPRELALEGLTKHLLVSNLTAAAMGEPIVGLEPTTETLLLIHRLPTDGLNQASLQSEVERFIAFVEHWQKEIQSENWRTTAPTAPESAPGQPPKGPFLNV